MFTQALWKRNLNSDTSLLTELQDLSLEFRINLHELARVHAPRWLDISSDVFCILHGFCDASSQTYVADIYVSIEGGFKEITIPRLEFYAPAGSYSTSLTHSGVIQL